MSGGVQQWGGGGGNNGGSTVEGCSTSKSRPSHHEQSPKQFEQKQS